MITLIDRICFTDKAVMSATPKQSFADLGLEARVCRALRKLNMTEPMQVQQQAIPEVRGNNVQTMLELEIDR